MCFSVSWNQSFTAEVISRNSRHKHCSKVREVDAVRATLVQELLSRSESTWYYWINQRCCCICWMIYKLIHFTPFRRSKTLLLCKSRGQAVQIPLWKLPEMGPPGGIPKPDDPREVWTGHLPASWRGEDRRAPCVDIVYECVSLRCLLQCINVKHTAGLKDRIKFKLLLYKNVSSQLLF